MSKISVVIPTRNRPSDVREVINDILNQTNKPKEIVIIDGSDDERTYEVYLSFLERARKEGVPLKYIKDPRMGLTVARNIAVREVSGEYVMFLDDDVRLGNRVLEIIENFLDSHPDILAVQPYIFEPRKIKVNTLKNCLYRVFLLPYYADNKCIVMRSFKSNNLRKLTRTIRPQRLGGCAFCVRKKVFNAIKFDEKLRRYSYMEDMDFTYRLYKMFPGSLAIIPRAKVLHKRSEVARMNVHELSLMKNVYWAYLFFKNMADSALNVIAFLYSFIIGRLIIQGLKILVRRDRNSILTFLSLINAIKYVMIHIKEIMEGSLEFFNKTL